MLEVALPHPMLLGMIYVVAKSVSPKVKPFEKKNENYGPTEPLRRR